MTESTTTDSAFVTPQQLLDHWQAHRRLTRRMIELFPDDQLFTFSIGGMRTFGMMANEMLNMAAPTVRGVATGEWTDSGKEKPATKAAILSAWDESTEQMNTMWPTIPIARFHESMKAFGQWQMRGNDLVLYVVDNEIHHRGQGYVYLRALNIEPPPFWERQ